MKISKEFKIAAITAVTIISLFVYIGHKGNKKAAARLAAWLADSTAMVQAGMKQGFVPVSKAIITAWVCTNHKADAGCIASEVRPARGILLRKPIGADDGVPVFRYWAQMLSGEVYQDYLALDGDTIFVHMKQYGEITISASAAK